MTGITELTVKVRVTTTRDLTEQQINEATEQIVGIVEGLTGPDDDGPVDVQVRSSHAPDPVYTGDDTSGTSDPAATGTVTDVLREHLWHHTSTTHCSCTWAATPGSEPVIEQWLAHVADQVTAHTQALPPDRRLDEDTNSWLAQVEARVAAAPPARVNEPGCGYDPEQGAVWTSAVSPDKWTGDASLAQHKVCDAHPDAAPFIAHARADLPRAVALIRNLTS